MQLEAERAAAQRAEQMRLQAEESLAAQRAGMEERLVSQRVQLDTDKDRLQDQLRQQELELQLVVRRFQTRVQALEHA